MSETPGPDEPQAGPPGPPDQPDRPTEILPTGEQSEAAEAPQPSGPGAPAPDAAAREAGAFAPPGGTSAGPGQGDTFAGPDGAFASQDGTFAGQGGTFAGQGGTFAGQPWPGSAPADLRSVTGPAPVLMSFGPPASQQRVTVAFRAILAIPQFFVLIFVLIAAEVVAFIGWWAALFTGQLPEWAHEFLTGALRWQARVNGYLFFLTDRYPPFSLADADYPIRLFTKRTRLNRLAVFFRVILAIPVYIVTEIVSIGLGILGIGAWVITLFTGQMPSRLHESFAAMIRWDARFYGYIFLLTPEYPAALYGDAKPAPVISPVVASEPAAAETASADTPTGAATDSELTAGGTTAEQAPSPQVPSTADDPWRLVLPEGARTLVTVALVIGFLGFAANWAFEGIQLSKASNTVNKAVAYAAVTGDYNTLGGVVTSFQSKVQACDQNLSCVTALDGQVAKAFQTFGTQLQGAGVPSSYSGEVSTLMADNNSVASDLNKLAGAQSASQYTSVAAGLNLEGDLSSWQTAYNQLAKSLQPAG
jgi:hypothetical protein